MAVDICSEISSPSVSPRISFSDDVRKEDDDIVDDFNFCITQNLPQQISSADELFADGKILPLKINKTGMRQSDPNILAHKKTAIDGIMKPQKSLVVDANDQNTKKKKKKKKRLIEFLSAGFDSDEEEEEEDEASASSSSNGGSSDDGWSSFGGLLRSLHFLKRSNSTGSSVKNPSAVRKVMQKQRSLKEASNYNFRSDSSSNINHYYYPNYNTSSLRRPNCNLKKSSNKSYGNAGAKISPVLNIPPAYIAKGTASLFGIGSFFCTKKSNKNKK